MQNQMHLCLCASLTLTGKSRIPIFGNVVRSLLSPTDGRRRDATRGGRKSPVNETIEYLMHCARNTLTIQHQMPLEFGKQGSIGAFQIRGTRGVRVSTKTYQT